MVTYHYQRVTYNGVKGWFCTRRIDGRFGGRAFGVTQKAARENFI